MSHHSVELRVRRDAIAQMVKLSEHDLIAVRNSAALGGHSRAILLQLERKLHAERKTLAEIEAALTQAAQAATARTSAAARTTRSSSDGPSAS